MIRIRLAAPADAAAIAGIYAPAVASRATSFEVDPPDGQEMARRVATTLERLPWLVCEEGGRVLGYAYASRHRDRAAYQWSVEVSAYVASSAHRRGVGRALYTSLFAILGALGYRNAYAGITLPNAASVGLHEAVGFTPVGVYRGIGWKMGAWHDVLWMERQLHDPGTPPPPPRPLPEVVDTPEFRAALGRGVPLVRPALAE